MKASKELAICTTFDENGNVLGRTWSWGADISDELHIEQRRAWRILQQRFHLPRSTKPPVENETQLSASSRKQSRKRKPEHVRAAIYYRSNLGNNALHTERMMVCRDFCLSRGYEVVKFFQDATKILRASTVAREEVDVDVLLANFEREHIDQGWQAAQEFMNKGLADVLVVYSPDCIVRLKHMLADVLPYLPPIEFATSWQAFEENWATRST